MSAHLQGRLAIGRLEGWKAGVGRPYSQRGGDASLESFPIPEMLAESNIERTLSDRYPHLDVIIVLSFKQGSLTNVCILSSDSR